MFKPKKIDLSAKGFHKIFGELETHIMEIIWERGELSIKEVRDELKKKYKDLSFNSVMTVMNRLVDKGVLKKKYHKKVNIYSAKIDKEQLGKIIARDMIGAIFRDPQIFGVLNFTDLASDLDKQALEKLQQFLNANKRARKNVKKE